VSLHPTATLCRCGVSLDLCADCRGWLAEHARAIELLWKVRLTWWAKYPEAPASGWSEESEAADFREGLYLASYKLLRQ